MRHAFIRRAVGMCRSSLNTDGMAIRKRSTNLALENKFSYVPLNGRKPEIGFFFLEKMPVNYLDSNSKP